MEKSDEGASRSKKIREFRKILDIFRRRNKPLEKELEHFRSRSSSLEGDFREFQKEIQENWKGRGQTVRKGT